MFTLPEAAGAATMHLRVDASDDLARWRSVVPDAMLVNLEYAGRRLVRDRVDIPPSRSKYLRLSWSVGTPVIEFTAVRGEFAERVVESPRQWRVVSGTPVADHDGEFEYDLVGAYPVDRIDVTLAEPNSIVPAQIFARASAAEPWQPVESTVFYRLREPGGEVTSAPVPVAGGARRYWLLRFDPRSGASARVAPPLRAGWQPAELVFATRGPPPFTLAYGNRLATPGALPISTLVPGYDAAKGLPPASMPHRQAFRSSWAARTACASRRTSSAGCSGRASRSARLCWDGWRGGCRARWALRPNRGRRTRPLIDAATRSTPPRRARAARHPQDRAACGPRARSTAWSRC